LDRFKSLPLRFVFWAQQDDIVLAIRGAAAPERRLLTFLEHFHPLLRSHLHTGPRTVAQRLWEPCLRRLEPFRPWVVHFEASGDTNFWHMRWPINRSHNETAMKFHMDKTLSFWVDCAYESRKGKSPDCTRAKLIADILRDYERAGDAMRYLNAA